MKDLAVLVIAWKRPELLKATLESLFKQVEGLAYDVYVADNETSQATQEVIKEFPVKHVWHLPLNKGINWPIEYLLPDVLNHEFVCISDADLHYARPLSLYLDILKECPDFAVSKGLDAPEHPTDCVCWWRGEDWKIKPTERGGGMVMQSETLKSFFPLLNDNKDFDVHVSEKLVERGKKIAVLPGSVVHLAWRKGESTWADHSHAESYVIEDGKIVKVSD